MVLALLHFAHNVKEKTEHVLFSCPRFEAEIRQLAHIIREHVTPDSVAEIMFMSGKVRDAVSLTVA